MAGMRSWLGGMVAGVCFAGLVATGTADIVPGVADPGKPVVTYVDVPTPFNGMAFSPEERIVRHAWDFDNDGQVDWESATPATAWHTFTSEGEYTVVFRAFTLSGGEVPPAYLKVTVLAGKAVFQAPAARSMQVQSASPIQMAAPLSSDGVQKRKAIILSGSSEERFWYDCQEIHRLLCRNGFSTNDIYFLYYDGKSPYGTNPDGIIRSNCDKANLVAVANQLSTVMDADDQLFVFVDCHGMGYTGPDQIGGTSEQYGYLGGTASVDPGDELDYVERDFKLRSLYVGGSLGGNLGLNQWSVEYEGRGPQRYAYTRIMFRSHYANVYVATTGQYVSDSDVGIEMFTDYLRGDRNRDGIIDLAAGEVLDFDQDFQEPYNPATKVYDEDDWANSYKITDNYNFLNTVAPDGCYPYQLFDAGLDDKLEICFAYNGTNLIVHGTDSDNQGLFDGVDVNRDGDLDDWVSIDERLSLRSWLATDDDIRSIFAPLANTPTVFVMETCYAGGYAWDLRGANRVIMTACEEDAPSYGNYFMRYFLTGLAASNYAGCTMPNPEVADANSDGAVSMAEGFNFTSTYEPALEIPLYEDSGDGLPVEGPLPCGADGALGATVFLGTPPAGPQIVAGNDSLVTSEDTAATVDVLLNDSDRLGRPLSVASVGAAAHGSAAIAGTVIQYVPAANYCGVDSFSYTVANSVGNTAQASVSVTVTPVNDAPTAGADMLATVTAASATVAVLANDLDVDGDALSVTGVTQPAHGTVTFSSTSVTYTSVAGFSGADAFAYTVSDGHGGSAQGTVSVTVSVGSEPPVANADAVTTAEDWTVTIDVLLNDQGQSLSITSVGQASSGSPWISGSRVLYCPWGNYNGIDSFTYTVADSQGRTSQGLVSVTVTPVNDAPTAGADMLSTVTAASAPVAVLANDLDVDGDVLSVTGVTQPAHGTVTFSSTSVTYTSVAGFSGADTFTYTVSDGHGGSAQGTVNVTVNPASQPGTLGFSATSYSVTEGNSGTVNATITVTRTGGSDGAVSVNYATANGTATAGSDYTAANGTLSWTAGDSASKTFTVSVTGDTAVEANETVTLTLSGATGGAPLGTSSATLTINNDDAAGVGITYLGADGHNGAAAKACDASGTQLAGYGGGGSKWNTATVAKPALFDADGDNRYGDAGSYIVHGLVPSKTVAQEANLPGWIAASVTMGDGSPRFYTMGINSDSKYVDLRAGGQGYTVWDQDQCSVSLVTVFTFTVQDGVPGEFIVAFLTDAYGRGTSGYGGSSGDKTITMSGPGGSTSGAVMTPALRDQYSIAQNGQTVDAYFFKVVGATPGATFTITTSGGIRSGIGLLFETAAATQPSTLAFSAPTYSVTEGNSGMFNATITVTRTGGSDGAVSVSYATANGTATAGSDYTAANGTLSWASGDSASKTFTVSVTGDTAVEANETVTLTLSGATGGATLGTSSATLTINNDDVANVPPSCAISSPAAGETFTAPASITITATASDTDGSVSKVEFYNGATKLGEDLISPYSFAWISVAAGTYSLTAKATDNSGAVTTSAAKSVTVNPASQPGTLAFSAATYSVTEGNSGTVNATITVTRTGGSDGAVSVSYATANGTATAGSDYTAASGTLSWASGDSANKTFTVSVTGDTAVEANETVTLTLSGATGGAALGTSSATLTINNDDSSGGATAISFVGALLNTDGWRSSSVAKPAGTDPNGDGALGSDGWAMPNASGGMLSRSLPGYISSVNASVPLATYSGPEIDNWTQPIAATVANATPYALRQSARGSAWVTWYTIMIAKAGSYLVTVITDAGSDCNRLPGHLRIIAWADTGSTLNVDATGARNNVADYYVFRIDNAAAGSVYRVQGSVQTGDTGLDYTDQRLGGIAFEAVDPR